MEGRIPSVSVIIPTLNEASRIGTLIESLQAQTFRPLEIIVSDGPSTDGTADAARQYEGVQVVSAERGVSNGRNAGAAMARGEWLYFVDADVSLAPDFIASCQVELKRRRLDAACPHYWPNGSTWIIKLLHHGYNLLFWSMQKLVPSGGGSCIIVRREVFRRSAGFRAPPFEDMEFLRQVGSLGSKHRFGFISPVIGVSDRRFRSDGALRTALLYALVSPLFVLGLYGLARRVPYRFGHHQPADSVR
jgi:glycosyltransferase involved in cell wall biosynthesis